MCGFCGIFDTSRTPDVDATLVRRMTSLMAERGPDAAGFFAEPRLAVGHRRLTIIDLEAGEQPVYNETGDVLVVFNGEIFNYRELRESLLGLGHNFRTHTDTEVIVHAYEQYGVRCVEHFRGMFSFAVYDRRNSSLFLARDRLGVKPLYYTLSGNRILFASEVKPLLLAAGGRAEPDPVAIDFFVSVGYVPGERTIFRGIKKLLPGHLLEWRVGQSEPRIECYWDVPDEPAIPISLADAQDQLAALLRESVKLRMISDVPLGAFLSGGVDSSVIVAQMCELASGPVKTFSIGYADSPEHNELPFARSVAQHLGTDHVEHVLTHGDFFQNIADFVLRSEEPIVEGAGIALYHLAKRARKDVTVVLSGEGADEVLAGYPLYPIMRDVDRVRRIARATGSTWLAAQLARRSGSEKLTKYLDWAGSPLAARYHSIPNDVTQTVRSRLYSEELLRQSGGAVPQYFADLFGTLRNATELKRMSYVDLKSWLPDDLLIKADKMTMAASVELRVPFLDHKLLEFCLTLPDEIRLHERTGKYLLKQLAGRWLPKEIIYRKKQGFPVPLARWFRGALSGRITEILLDPRSLGRGYFRPDYVRTLLKRHQAGVEDHSRRLLTLVILEIWHRTFVDDICEPVRRELDDANRLRATGT